MSLQKVIKDMGIIGISQMLIRISGIVLLPFLTKTLGAYGYGLWSQALVTITLAVMLLRFGSPLSIVRLFPGKDIDRISQDLYSILTLIILVVGIFSIFLFSFPDILSNAIFDGNKSIVRIVAVIIFVSCLDKIFLAVFQAFREMKKHAIISVISTYIEVGLAISLVLLGYGLIGAILAVLIVRGAQSFVLFILIRNKLPLRRPNFSSLREYLSIGLPAMPGAISHLVVDISDRYVIGIFLGVTFVGYYTPGYTLGILVPSFITGVLAFVLLPSLSEYYEKNNMSMIKNLLNLSTKYFLLISIPTFIGIILVGKPMLSLFTTPEIAQEGHHILVLSAVAGLILGIYNIFKTSIFLKKRTKLFTSFWAIGASTNLIGNILFVPKIGIIAAAITTIISYFIVTILILRFSFKELPISIEYLPIAKIIFSSILMGSVLYLTSLYLWANTFFLIILGIFVYFLIIYMIGGIRKKEISFLKSIYK